MHRSLAAPLLIALAALLATWPALDGGLVYDDTTYLAENPAVTGDGSWWSSPLGTVEQGLWRPLTVGSWRLQWSGPDDLLALLAGNLALHVAASILLWLVALRLGCPPTGAWVAGLLFAVHPVHAEAVAWITGRAELLAAALALAAWWAWLSPSRFGPLLAAPLVALAGLSKENALAAPALFVLADLALGRGFRLRLVGTAALAVAATFAARLAVLPHALPAVGPFHDLPFAERIVVAINVLGRAFSLLAWPQPLRIEYHRSEFLVAEPFPFVLVAAWLAAVTLLWRRQRLPAIGLALAAAGLFPVLNLVPIGEPFAERFLYLPSVPFCLAAGALFAAWGRRELARPSGLGPSVATLLVLVLVAVPWSRHAVAAFRDDVTLWTRAVRAAPESAVAHYNLGDALDRAGRFLSRGPRDPGSLAALQRSLELSPNHVYAGFAHQLLGTHALGARGGPAAPAAAAHHFREALERMPGLADARINLAGLALTHQRLVDPVEGTTLLWPLRGREDLSAEQAATVEELLRQLSELATSSSSSTGTDVSNGTSSPAGS